MSNKRALYEAELKSQLKSFGELNNELEGTVLNLDTHTGWFGGRSGPGTSNYELIYNIPRRRPFSIERV